MVFNFSKSQAGRSGGRRRSRSSGQQFPSRGGDGNVRVLNEGWSSRQRSAMYFWSCPSTFVDHISRLAFALGLVGKLGLGSGASAAGTSSA